MAAEVIIREYASADAPGLAALFWESVRNGTGAHYSEEERNAWAPAVPDVKQWDARLSSMLTLVAEDAVGLAGFMTLEPDGHIDLAYVRSNLIGQGVAGQLYAELEASARQQGIASLHTEASHLAKSFFAKRGWTLIATQQVKSAGGRLLTNHLMTRDLRCG